MNNILFDNLDAFVVVYFDDIVVYNLTLNEAWEAFENGISAIEGATLTMYRTHCSHFINELFPISFEIIKDDSCPIGVSADSCPAGAPWLRE